MMKANIGKAQALAERTKTSKFLFRGIGKKNTVLHCTLKFCNQILLPICFFGFHKNTSTLNCGKRGGSHSFSL